MIKTQTLAGVALLSLIFASFLLSQLYLDNPKSKDNHIKDNNIIDPQQLFSDIRINNLSNFVDNKPNTVNTETNTKINDVQTYNINTATSTYHKREESGSVKYAKGAIQSDNGKDYAVQDLDYEKYLKQMLTETNSYEYNTKNTKQGNIYYDENFINYDYNYNNSRVNESDIARNKYKQEINYLNVLAVVLILYQHSNNNMEAIELSNKWLQKRDEKGKQQIIKEANDYEKISKILDKIQAPDMFASVHKRLKEAYFEASIKMRKIADVTSDEEMLKAMIDYNKSADKIILALIKVSDLISFAGIKIKPDEPASIFVFPGR